MDWNKATCRWEITESVSGKTKHAQICVEEKEALQTTTNIESKTFLTEAPWLFLHYKKLITQEETEPSDCPESPDPLALFPVRVNLFKRRNCTEEEERCMVVSAKLHMHSVRMRKRNAFQTSSKKNK